MIFCVGTDKKLQNSICWNQDLNPGPSIGAFQSSSTSSSSRISSMPSSPLSSPAEFASLFAPEAASLLATETEAEVFADFPEGSSLPELSGSALRFLRD